MLLRGRPVLIVGAIFFLLAWAIADGYMKFGKDNYSCFPRKSWYYSTPQQRFLQIGRLNLYYQPFAYGCQKDQQYDPTQYEIKNGQLVPKGLTE
jgi:hypothetical protein